MADMYELTKQDYENCYLDERSKNMPNNKFEDILERPDFQELTKNLLETSEDYYLTEDVTYNINNKYFRWDGHKMVEIPEAEITEEMIDDNIEITSADYALKIEREYEEETLKNMPDFKDIEFMPDFENWVYKTIKFMMYKPAHGDIIDISCTGYRNEGKHQWDAINKKLVELYTGIDDYGSCNPMFRVGDQSGEFSPEHWHAASSYQSGGRINYYGVIDHNNFVVLSKKLVSEITIKLSPTKRGYKCQIMIAGQPFTVITVRNNLNSDNVPDCTFQYDHGDRLFIQEF